MNVPYCLDFHFLPLTSSGGGSTFSLNLICLVKWQILKPVRGYEGKYFISNTGFLYTNKLFKPKRPYDDGKGYQKVDLFKNGKKKRFYLHRLVYETFLGRLRPTHEVDHNNCDRGCNKLYNLRRMTRKQNMKKMLIQNPHVLANLNGCNHANSEIQSAIH